MLDYPALGGLIEQLDYDALFVTVSGAHLYGFPSPDSDIDLRGCHRLPLRDVVGLDLPRETLERKLDLAGIEVELVSHDLGKYLRLLVKNNGYILEQIFSPLVVCGQEFLDRLRPLAQACITRHHYHHYRGFYATQRQLMAKEEPPRLKSVLYAYRVLLTGIHLLRSGVVEANLPRLASEYDLPFVPELIAQKTQERAAAPAFDWAFHDAKLNELEARMVRAFDQSRLPEDRDRRSVSEFLVGVRMGSGGTA